MRIDSPKVSNLTFQTGSGVQDSSFTGSFSGSFTGVGNFTGLTADSVEYANVLNKPAGLVSGSSAQARSQIGVGIGTDVQAYHDNLNDISNLNPTDSTFIVGAGSSFVLESGTTVRASLGLGSLATLNTNSTLSSVDLSGNTSITFNNVASKPALVSGSQSEVLSFLGVEAGATADQSNAEIKTAYEANADTNEFSDAEQTKLANIEANATADQTNSEIKTAYEANSDTNAFTDAEQTKLSNIATSATNTEAPAIISDGSTPTLASGITAAEVRSLISADSAGTDNSTDVTLANTNYLTLDGQEITGGTVPVGSGGTGATTAGAARTALGVDAAGTDNSTDVTLSGTPDYITISGQTITRNQIDLTADVTGDLPVAEGGTGASTAAAARSNLGVDAAGTDNSTDVTLAGTLDYITISGQAITRNAINLATDVTGTLPVGNMAATALTTVQTADDETAQLGLTAQEGDVVVRSDQNKTYMHNGGTAGTMDDYTLLATPTDSVTSVNGSTGVVTVTENVTTNLSITGTTGARTIVSSDGTNAVIPVATDSVSGVMSAADHTRLSGIEDNANNYVLPTNLAGDDISIDTGALTGATVISDLDLNVTTNTSGLVTDANGTVATRTLTLADLGYTGASNANNYVLPTNLAGDDIDIDTGALTGATVVSDIDINITTDTSGRVTDANGAVATRTLTLANLGYTGATNANNYSHPTFNGDDISIDTGALTGATVISDLDFNVTTDTNGHVTDANGTVATRTLTLANLGYTGATNANYITNNNQLTNGAGYTTYSSNQTLNNNSNVHFEGLMVGQTSGATANTIRCVGDIVAYYSSDQQFKDNIVTLDGALDKVKAIRGVRFDWNDKQDVYEGHDIGVVAQEVEAVLPELVHYREHNDSKAVDYVKLTAVLVEAVKELSARVEELESK